ncbi:MAG TPA: 16S rRNA (cytidine(1402)-2'-O)-methyltransferase [Pseudomonadales bacterium]|nr:16S rRNA (cytidine(1402)-2'-O)-methyltransferase [Pseudomonadales bacterium]
MNQSTATLYVVATPIGNLQDMQPRAIDVLRSVALIAAEDSRHSAPLLRHFEIGTPVWAYHDHSDQQRTDAIISRLMAGEDVALISDAGTPLISDPGYRLVDAAHQHGVRVCPIPGACAMLAALSASGLPTDRFSFVGFLPAKSQARSNVLSGYVKATDTLVFYEAPHRLLDTLKDMQAMFGDDRMVVLARELTKMFETIRRLPLGEMVVWVESDANQQRGECVLLLKGCIESGASLTPEAEKTMRVLAEELPLKQAASLASKITGLKKNALYQWALETLKT